MALKAKNSAKTPSVATASTKASRRVLLDECTAKTVKELTAKEISQAVSTDLRLLRRFRFSS